MLTDFAERTRTCRSRYAQFGPRYAALAPLRSLAITAARRLGKTSEDIEAELLRIEGSAGVLGPAHRAYTGHSPSENRAIWSAWDWSQRGDEWNDTDEPERWKATLIDEVLLANLADARAILEIGPGAGRWSAVLQAHAERLVLVDVTQRALDLSRERLADAGNVEYVLSEGGAFPGVADGCIDWVWSFDVFVHIAPLDVASYVTEIARVLRPGGTALIHHSGALQRSPGWRSPMTAVLFARLAADRPRHGQVVARQADPYGLRIFDPSYRRDSGFLFAAARGLGEVLLHRTAQVLGDAAQEVLAVLRHRRAAVGVDPDDARLTVGGLRGGGEQRRDAGTDRRRGEPDNPEALERRRST